MDSINRSLFVELERTHRHLLEVDEQLQNIREQWELAATRYAKVRDLLGVRLGVSAYAIFGDDQDGNWTAEALRLRLVHMSITEAVNTVLDEAETPLSVQQIVAELTWGGYEFPKDSAPARVVQAAVANRKGLLKEEATGVSKYYAPGSYAAHQIEFHVEVDRSQKGDTGDTEPDDLPF